MAGSKNTALTENDKLQEARRKDFEANLKSTSKAEPGEQTAVHLNTLPSDIDSVATRYGLTTAEAERVLEQTDGGPGDVDEGTVDEVVADRTVYRQVWVETPAGVSHPLSGLSVPAAAPAPPAVELLDPNAPRGDEPTGSVAGHDHSEEAAALADAYAERSEESVEGVDEATDAAGDTDVPTVPVE